MTLTMTLPPRFVYDHWSRDLPEEGTSTKVSETKRTVTVEMDWPAAVDLYSDAKHYSDAGIAQDMGLRGLAASARATVAAMRRQAPEVAAAYEAGW